MQASILRPHRVRPAPRGNVFHSPRRPDRRFLAAGNGDRTFRDLPRDTRRHPGRSGSDGQRRLNAGAVLYLYAGRLCLHGRYIARHVIRASNIADPTDFAATQPFYSARTRIAPRFQERSLPGGAQKSLPETKKTVSLCPHRKAQIVFAAGIFKRAKNATGCSAVRLAHLLWEQGVAGSNPVSPTGNGRTFRLCRFLLKDASSTTDFASLNDNRQHSPPKESITAVCNKPRNFTSCGASFQRKRRSSGESLSSWRILRFRMILRIQYSAMSKTIS